jgi:Beta-lactamase enzyme family
MASPRRVVVAIAATGTAVLVAATLVLFLGLGGNGGDHPGTAGAGISAAGQAAAGSPARPGPDLAAGHDTLSAAAAAYLAGRRGTVLAAVYDVRTGQTWQFGDGPAQPAASIVKLDILETMLARPRSAALSPADQALARSMIEDSDNEAATSLWNEDGGADGLTYYGDRAGLTQTTPSACVACAGFAFPGWGLSTTVPQDQLTLLKQLVVPGPRPLLSGAARSYALSLMKHVADGQRWGITGGVPAGVTVALKDGWLPLNAAATNWQVNSIGWVSGHGRNYLIAVLCTGNRTEKYGIDTISGLSSLVWAALG